MSPSRNRGRQAALAPALGFALFTLTGALFIVIAKLFDQNPFIVTFTPVGLMLAYALALLLAPGLRLRDDQTGDNFYYMGFIFTLTSLGVSLYQFTADTSVEEIVRNFGIAVATTIAGIALRIAFVQTRRDPVELEGAARYELADASRRVRRELDGIVQELAHFRRTNQQMLTEGFHEIHADVEASSKASLAAISSVSETALAAIRRTDAALGSGADGLAGGARALASLEADLKAVAERLAAQERQQAELVAALGRLTTALERAQARGVGSASAPEAGWRRTLARLLTRGAGAGGGSD